MARSGQICNEWTNMQKVWSNLQNLFLAAYLGLEVWKILSIFAGRNVNSKRKEQCRGHQHARRAGLLEEGNLREQRP